MTFEEWYDYHKDTRNGTLRIGQKMFNDLCTVRPDLSERVRATSIDPFFSTERDDERLVNFLVFVEEHW